MLIMPHSVTSRQPATSRRPFINITIITIVDTITIH
jgi:hypothetical protein